MIFQKLLKKGNDTKISLELFAFFSLFIGITTIYILFHIAYLIGFYIFIVVFFLSYLYKGFGEKRWNINIKKVAFAILLAQFATLQIYLIQFQQTTYTGLLSVQDQIFYLVNSNFNFYSNLVVGLCFTIIFLAASINIGQKIVKVLVNNPNQKILEKSDYLFISFLVGLIPISYAIFLIAKFNFINVYGIGLLIVILSLLSVREILRASEYIRRYKNFKFNLQITRLKFALGLCLILFSGSLITVISRGFILGSDGLRLYLLTVKHIVSTGGLPNQHSMHIPPFPLELLTIPPYFLGQESAAITFLQLTSIFGFFWGLILISKIILNKTTPKSMAILSALFFPPLITLIGGEFKIDVLLGMFIVGVLILFYSYLKTANNKLLLIGGLLAGFCLLAKATSILIIFPVFVGILIKAVYTKPTAIHLKSVFLSTIFGLVVIAPWFIFYVGEIPTIDSYGLNLLNQHSDVDFIKADYQANSCNKQLADYEQYRYSNQFTRTFEGYIKLPIIYLTTGSTIKAFSLIDIGLIIPTLVLGLIISLLFNLKTNISIISRFKKANLAIFYVGIIATLMLWLSQTPIYLWYILPIFSVIALTFYNAIYILSDPKLIHKINQILAIIISSYALTFVFFTGILWFYPPKITHNDLLKYFSNSEMHTVMQEVLEKSNFLNSDYSSGNILYTSSLPFDNMGYFTKDHIHRVYFLDKMTESPSKAQLREIIYKHEIEYIVLSNNYLSIESLYECYEEYHFNLKEILDEIGIIELKTDKFTIYRPI